MSNNLWDHYLLDARSNCKTRIKRSLIYEDILTGRKLFQVFREILKRATIYLFAEAGLKQDMVVFGAIAVQLFLLKMLYFTFSIPHCR